MADGIRWVGLDVHAHESTVAVFDQGTGELSTKRVAGRPRELLPWLRGVARPARMVYEAGPTGYGLARRARAEGIVLVVCAPGRTERRPGDRIKTEAQRDRRGRDRPRARRVLLGDRHLEPPSRPCSAGVHASGRPPHTGTRSIPPKQESAIA